MLDEEGLSGSVTASGGGSGLRGLRVEITLHDAAPADRDEIAIDDDNFPTDRYLVEGVAAERGLTVRWIGVDREQGVTAELVAEAVGERTALVVLSHVAYRSGFLADVAAITRVVHDAGAPVLGGGWTLPPGRSGLPLRLHEGRTVLVPTRDPAALRAALLAAVSDASDGHSGREGTLGS